MYQNTIMRVNGAWTKRYCHWPLCGEFTGERWIPCTNGQWRGKCFHLMTSLWYRSGRVRMIHPIKEIIKVMHYFAFAPDWIWWYNHFCHIILSVVNQYVFPLFSTCLSIYENIRDVKQPRILMKQLFSHVYRVNKSLSWWRHQMETFSALLAPCNGNPPVTGQQLIGINDKK